MSSGGSLLAEIGYQFAKRLYESLIEGKPVKKMPLMSWLEADEFNALRVQASLERARRAVAKKKAG